MGSVLDLIREGGIWMWGVLLVGLPGLLAPLLLAGLSAARVRVPAVLWWFLAGVALLPGAPGTWLGFTKGLEVLPMVEPSARGVLAHAVIAEGVVPAMCGAGFAGLALVLAAMLAGAVSLTGDDIARRVELRVASAVALPLGFGALAVSWKLSAMRELHRAMSLAAPEQRAALVAAVGEQGSLALLVAPTFALIVAVGILATVAGSLGTRRILVNAIVGVVGLFLVLVPAGLGVMVGRELYQVMPETHEATLRERLPDLPTSADLEREDQAVESFSLPVGAWSVGVWTDVLGGQPIESPHTVAFPASGPGSQLAKLPAGSYRLLVEQGRSLGGMPFDVEQPDEANEVDSRFPNTLFVTEKGVGASLACFNCPSVEVESLDGLPARLEKLLGAGSAAEELVIVPTERWTVGTVASVCLTGRAKHDGQLACTVMSAAPSFEAAALADLPPGDGGVTAGQDPIILGALDRSLIDAVVRRSMGGIKYCYERALHRDPDLQGKIVVKFVIDNAGGVSSSTIKSTTMNNERLESCVAKQFERLHFPEPKGGGIAIVSYPLNFQ